MLEWLSSIGISEVVLQLMLISAIMGLSIYFTLYTGMFSLANAAFMAIGAYVGALFSTQLDQPLGVCLIAGALVAGLIAIPIGLPVLRLRDIYLAIATLGFGEIVRIFLINFDSVIAEILRNQTGERVRYELLGGARGIRTIPTHTETWHLILFVLILVFLITRLNRSRLGRAMAAIRQDEKAAANMGINVVYVKNMVFVIGAMIAGAGGVFFAHLIRNITPSMFGFDRAVDILAYAVLGGVSTWIGPIVGGFTLTGIPEVLRFSQDYRGVFIGLVLLLIIVYFPGGLINPAAWRAFWQKVRRTDA